MARKRLLTVEEGALIHLLAFVRVEPGDTAPIDITQAGISRALGARRSHVSLSLESAKARGAVEEHLSRVRWEKRKLKCYYLTPAGVNQARASEARVLEAGVEAALTDGGTYIGSMRGLHREHGSGMGLAALALQWIAGKVAMPAGQVGGSEQPDFATAPRTVPLHGRDRELAMLEPLFSGQAKVAIVSGMPGIGKTSLVAHAASRHPRDGTFWFAVREWSTPRNTATHLAGFLSGLGQDRMRRYLDSNGSMDLADLGDIIGSAGVRAVLVLDDVHRAGADMSAFVRMLAEACSAGMGLSVCLVGRRLDALAHPRPVSGPVLEVSLRPLDEAASMAILADRGIPEELARPMARRGGGNPLFLTMVAHAPESGAPRDPEEFLASEVDASLSKREREIMQLLSVFREPVPAAAVAESEEDFFTIDSLRRRGLLEGARVISLHGVLRDFYASRQTARGRIERHERAAEYYTLRRSRAGDLVEEVHHLLAAGETDSAAIALAAGGQGILVHGHVEEVLSLAARIPSDWKNSEQAFDLAFLRGTALDILGRWPEARAEYERCIGLAEEMEDAERKAETLRRLGAIEYRQGGPHAALALFEEALALAATEQTKAELHGSIGVVRWKLGEFEAAKQSHERDLELSRTLESPRGISRALNNLGILDWQAGNHLAALDRYSEALRQAEIIPDRRLIAAIYSNIGDAHRALGRPEEARRYYERCLELAEDLKFNWQVAEACRGLAEVVTERRKHYLSRALSIFERLGAAGDAKTVREMMP